MIILCSLELFGYVICTGPPRPVARFCDIYSPNLTTSGGILYIANGAKNVILYCICNRKNHVGDYYVAVGPTTWFINGTKVTRTEADGHGNPYTPTLVGTYGCGGHYPTEPNVTINLTMFGKY